MDASAQTLHRKHAAITRTITDGAWTRGDMSGSSSADDCPSACGMSTGQGVAAGLETRLVETRLYFSIASRVALNSLPGFHSGTFDALATL